MLLAAAAVAVWVGLAALGAADAAALTPGERTYAVVRERVFWMTTLQSLLLGYATFEILFRAADASFVGLLPLRGRTRFVDLMVRAYALHLPLLLAPAGYAFGLLDAGAPTGLPAYAAATPALTLLAGLALAAAAHLAAGRSLLSESSHLRKLLASHIVADEHALLLYSPAAALAGALVLGVLNDLFLFHALTADRGDLLALPFAWSAVTLVVALVAAARIADAALFPIMARFTEAEAPPPYREDGVPATTPGAGLARLLPPPARPYFLRDLKQLRRRHRIDRVMLWLHGLIAGRLAFTATAELTPAPVFLPLLGAFVGLFLVSGFRLEGPELDSPWLARTLPSRPRDERLGRLAASLIHPAWAVLAAAVAATVAGGLVAGVVVLLGGALLALTLTWGALHLARLARADRMMVAATAWRAAVVSLTGAVLWSIP